MKRFALLLVLFATPALADDHVVILLDTSGSMAEGLRKPWQGHRTTKIVAAQQSLAYILNTMPSTTKLGLLTFNGWAFPLGPVDKSKAVAAVSKTYPGGGTPLGEYMKLGADKLLASRDDNHGVGTYTLLVVTDGRATDEYLMEKNVVDIVARGLTLKTIGVDLDQAHLLAQKSISYSSADDSETLKTALERAVAEVPAGNDNVIEDAYAMIAGIPNQMVSPIIGTITSTITFNQPIGEKPKVKVVDERGNVSFVTQPVKTEIPWVTYFFIVIIVVVGLLFLYKIIGQR